MSIIKINRAVTLLLLALSTAPPLTAAKLGKDHKKPRSDDDKALKNKQHEEKLKLIPKGRTRAELAGTCSDAHPRGYQWVDSDGYPFNCYWYSQGNRCEQYGSDYAGPLPPPNYEGLWNVVPQTAQEACCACGGGVRPQPCTLDGTEWNKRCHCEDLPDRGMMCLVAQENVDGCNDDSWGDPYGATNEVCCVCGGGHNTVVGVAQ